MSGYLLRPFAVLFLFGAFGLNAQIPAPGTIRSDSEPNALPMEVAPASRASVERAPVMNSKSVSRADFVKDLTIESFGYDLSPYAPGFEGSRLSEGQSTAHGLECPYCIMSPLMTRSRFSLQPFGTQATLHTAGQRVEVFTGAGGVEAWRPDSLFVPKRKGSMYNDSWLVQSQGGSNFAIDPGRHIWLGGTGRYLENLGEGRKHWNTFSGNAIFRLGHQGN